MNKIIEDIKKLFEEKEIYLNSNDCMDYFGYDTKTKKGYVMIVDDYGFSQSGDYYFGLVVSLYSITDMKGVELKTEFNVGITDWKWIRADEFDEALKDIGFDDEMEFEGWLNE